MNKPTKLRFKTHAELKNVIGQDLINDDNIAIIELVKNGLDAGSKEVTIEFLGAVSREDSQKRESASIVVSDRGSGMSERDIIDKWLNIAYSEKKHFKTKERLLAGNKGVGRFACDRLGKRLDLYTKRARGQLLRLSVDWTEFEDKSQLDYAIERVEVNLSHLSAREYRALTGREPFETGTVLWVTDLRSPWDRPKLLGLKRDLERFVDPNAAFDKASFLIRLSAPEQTKADVSAPRHERLNGKVENQIFQKLRFNTTYLSSEIDHEAKRITTELFHDGERVYRIVEKNASFNLLANTRLTMHYLNPYKKAYFKRETGQHTVEFGSIFLFLNGYRIPPYGNRDNDWLRLDNRKTQGTSRYLGARELLGRIEVRDEDGRFRVVSNREGIARGDAFRQLIDEPDGFFYRGLKRLERFVVDGLKWDSVPDEMRRALEEGVFPRSAGKQTVENYLESKDKKTRRVALDFLRILGANPATTLELTVDPALLDTLASEREEEVRSMLEKFSAYEGSADRTLKTALARVRGEFERQREALAKAQRAERRRAHQVSRLTAVARTASGKAKALADQVKTQRTELLFLRSSAAVDKDVLMSMHHQVGIVADRALNMLNRLMRKLRESGSDREVDELAEKALRNVQRIQAVVAMATRANFRLKTEDMRADLGSFIQDYLSNVASEVAAQNLRLSVERTFETAFETTFKPIEVAIIFDNLASNAEKAGARQMNVELALASQNELRVRVWDDGPGIPVEVKPPESVFEKGVTTTRGSGLGLYHVRETVRSMGGAISLEKPSTRGFGVEMRFFK